VDTTLDSATANASSARRPPAPRSSAKANREQFGRHDGFKPEPVEDVQNELVGYKREPDAREASDDSHAPVNALRYWASL
jgi:hypothetical protein